MVTQDAHIHSPILPSEAFLNALQAQYEVDCEVALIAFSHRRGKPDINAFYEDNPERLEANMNRFEDEANSFHPDLGHDHVKKMLGFVPAILKKQKLDELASELSQCDPDKETVQECLEYLAGDTSNPISEAQTRAVVQEPVAKVLRDRTDFFRTMLKLSTVITNEIAKNGDFDGMTQVFNKAALTRNLNAMIAVCNSQSSEHHRRADDVDTSAAEETSQIAVLMIDLDGFKATNDFVGHGAGDAVLIKVAEELKAAVRDGDIVGRLGGDEFAVAVRVKDEAEAQIIKARVEKIFQDHTIQYDVEGNLTQAGKSAEELAKKGFDFGLTETGMEIRVPVRASVGMVMADLNEDSNHALKAADTYMFEQKKKHHAADPSLKRG